MTALLILTVACKKTVESEKKAWERNLKKIERLSLDYPNFQHVLQVQKKKAVAVMKAAESISSEDEKIKKLSEANSVINAAFVRNLDSIKSKKKSLRNEIIKVRGLKMEMNERLSANRAISDADRVISEADDKIRQDVDTVSQAEALTSLVLSDLKSAESGLETVSRRIKDRIASEKKAELDKKKAVEKEEAAKKELAKPVKCPYCGTLNPPGKSKCKGCGAPLPEK